MVEKRSETLNKPSLLIQNSSLEALAKLIVKSSAIICLGILTSQCSTPNGASSNRFNEVPSPIAKPRDQASQVVAPAKPVTARIDETRYMEVIKGDFQPSEKDIELLGESKAAAQSLQEAVELILVLKQLSLNSQNKGYVASDLNAPQADEAKSVTEIQSAAQSLGFKRAFWNSLAQNPFTQLPVIFRYVDRAIDSLGNAPKDRLLLEKLIDHRTNSWMKLAKQPGGPADSEPTSTSEAALESAPVESYSLNDINQTDSILRQAIELAENGEFKQALELITKIDQKDPMFTAAEEQIKSISNRAVQSLRQKAALAFQNALPVGDPKTRAAYLSEAKEYLVEALENFPMADHLATVKENLAVISRNLENISEDTPEDDVSTQ